MTALIGAKQSCVASPFSGAGASSVSFSFTCWRQDPFPSKRMGRRSPECQGAGHTLEIGDMDRRGFNGYDDFSVDRRFDLLLDDLEYVGRITESAELGDLHLRIDSF